MGKKKLREQIESQQKTIDDQKKLIDLQCKATENVMYIFKVLLEGGHLSVHIHPDKGPSYFLTEKGGKSDCEFCTRKIFEGLYSRGLLTVTNESVLENFAAQTYVLRIPTEK